MENVRCLARSVVPTLDDIHAFFGSPSPILIFFNPMEAIFPGAFPNPSFIYTIWLGST